MQDLMLSKGEKVLDLGELLRGSSAGTQVLTGVTGLGLPNVAVQWFEGAGDGSSWQGSRVLPRDLDLPLLIDGGDAARVQEIASRMAQILDPRTGQARLWLVRGDDRRFADVVRVSGGSWTSGSGSDSDSWFTTMLTVRAGDPFWTRQDASDFEVRIRSEGRGLLPALSRLRLTSSQAMGSRTVENPGDAPAYPVWRVRGPGRNFTATSPTGEVLRWEGILTAAETITIDTYAGTVVDQAGTNRYDKLAAAPRFWLIEPGESIVSVTLDNATTDSRITCSWQPRWWVSF